MSGYFPFSLSSFLLFLFASMRLLSTLATCGVIPIGKLDNVLASNSSIWISNPLDKDSIKAIPIIPIEDAKAVINVLPHFVIILLKLKFNAVKKTLN